MSVGKRRLVDVVTDDVYLQGLAEKSLDELRRMRDECRDAENEISFERRLCQARIDILNAELAQRRGDSDSDLLDRLPEILAKDIETGSGPLPARAPDFSIPRNADIPRRRVEEIVGEQTLARLAHVSTEELTGVVESLRSHERELSDRRKRLHQTMDALQSEIVRRFTSGEADPAKAFENR